MRKDGQHKTGAASVVQAVERRFAGCEDQPQLQALKAVAIRLAQAGNSAPAPAHAVAAGRAADLDVLLPDEPTVDFGVFNVRYELEKVSHLFTLPDHVLRITRMLEDHRADTDELCREIKRDPALVAEILRVVNSGFYGFQQRVATIDRAVVILGFNVIHALVLSISVVNLSVVQKLWTHSVACATAAALLARRVRLPRPEEVGIVGLLHDIGKAIMMEYVKRGYVATIARANAERLVLYEAERHLLGLTHADVGRWLLERWNLPPETVEPIGRHHDLQPDSPHAGRTDVVHIADILVRALGFDSGADVRIPCLHPQALSVIGCSLDDLTTLMADLAPTLCRDV